MSVCTTDLYKYMKSLGNDVQSVTDNTKSNISGIFIMALLK